MRRDVLRTLTRWEAGELSDEEVRRQHPEAIKLLTVHDQLASLSAEPLPSLSIDRAALEAMLPDRIEDVRDTRARRVIAVAVAAATLCASSVAYAAGVEPVRRTVDTVVDRIGDMLTRDAPATGRSGDRAPRADEPGDGTGGKTGAPQQDDDGDGGETDLDPEAKTGATGAGDDEADAEDDDTVGNDDDERDDDSEDDEDTDESDDD